MNVESAVDRVRELVRPRAAVPSRIGLRLAPVERRYMLILGDLLLVNSSLLAAVMIWNGFVPSLPVVWAYNKWFITLSVVWMVLGMILDVYNLARAASTTSIVLHAGLAALLSAILYLAIPWLTPPVLSRTYAFGFVLLTVLTVLIWRVLYAQTLAQPAFRRRALILQASTPGHEALHALQEAARGDDANPFRGTGYQIVGLVSCAPAQGDENVDGIRLLGSADQLVRLSRQYDIDEIILAAEDENGLPVEVHEVLLDCRELGLPVTTLAAIYERLTGRLPVEYARRDLDLILSPADGPGLRLYTALKRMIDVVLALLGLWVLAQVLPAIALANKLWSPGPLFYRQQRVGKGGRPFVVSKFRSMIPDAEKSTGAVWSAENDPRITPIGQVLRKTRLDELPQLVNVLRGEMSIVGPRPERPQFVGELSHALPLYRARHAVKPGLTGWAQVCYRYGNTVEDARVKLEYDLYYVKHASLTMDLDILLHTVRVVLGFKGH